ncbi:MAG: AMP-binding protein, partial [Clostridia bacterium]|nr:AMP-binding protein [Clostridia bacterium]
MITHNQTESNQQMPLIISTPADSIKIEPLITRIRKVAAGNNTITFVGSAAGNAEKEHLTLTWGELHRDAMAVAAILQAKGVNPGDHVALLGPTTRNLVTAIQAVWLVGASVSMLPIPMRFG